MTYHPVNPHPIFPEHKLDDVAWLMVTKQGSRRRLTTVAASATEEELREAIARFGAGTYRIVPFTTSPDGRSVQLPGVVGIEIPEQDDDEVSAAERIATLEFVLGQYRAVVHDLRARLEQESADLLAEFVARQREMHEEREEALRVREEDREAERRAREEYREAMRRSREDEWQERQHQRHEEELRRQQQSHEESLAGLRQQYEQGLSAMAEVAELRRRAEVEVLEERLRLAKRQLELERGDRLEQQQAREERDRQSHLPPEILHEVFRRRLDARFPKPSHQLIEAAVQNVAPAVADALGESNVFARLLDRLQGDSGPRFASNDFDPELDELSL